MTISEQLELCCMDLDNHGVRKRKEAVSELMELLHTSAVVNFLNNENDGMWWLRLLVAIQGCLIQDCDSVYKKYEKTGSLVVLGVRTGDLLAYYVRIAIRENALKQPRKLVLFLIESLKIVDRRMVFENCFVNNISFLLLSSSKTRTSLHQKDWEELCAIFQTLCGPKKLPDASAIKAFTLVLKFGSLYTLPVDLLREQFKFICDLSHTILDSKELAQQEPIVELLFEFGKIVAKDCRMSVCKLGENLFSKLLTLYERQSIDRIRIALLDFFLLQVKVHNPKGVKHEHPTAYAVSWNIWSNSLVRLFYILRNEVEQCLIKSSVCIKSSEKTLLESFIFLFVDVSKQVFQYDSLNIGADGEVAFKKQRIDINFNNLLENVSNSTSWEWIQLAAAFAYTYPDMITSRNYLKFVQILSHRIDEKNPNIRHNVYLALIKLDEIQDVVNPMGHSDKIQKIWNTIIDSIIRLHQNEDTTQKLLQSFIKRRSIKCDALVQNYRSESSVNVTLEILATLNRMFEQFPFLQSDDSLKSVIMKWILHENNLKNAPDIFSDPILSKTLVYLILKQRPEMKRHRESVSKPFSDIENIYEHTSFETLIEVVSSDKKMKQSENHFLCDNTLRDTLIEHVMLLSTKCDDDNIERLLYITLLLFNVLSYLSKYQLVPVKDSQLYQQLNVFVEKVFGRIVIDPQKNEDVSLDKIISHVNIIKKLFLNKVDVDMGMQLRQIVPKDFIRSMFYNLDTKVEDSLPLKKTLMECLMYFSCLPDASKLSDVQIKSLECLLNTQYACDEDTDYGLVLSLFSSLKTCNVSSFENENLIEALFNLFQTMCAARYECYNGAVDLLNIFYEIYPIIFCSDSETCKSNMVNFLIPFFDRIDKYGPEISIKLIKCIGLLFKYDPACNFSRYGNDEFIFKLPQFLANDYQEVRFVALENIVSFFQTASKTRLMSYFHRQEMMFNAIYTVSNNIFEVEGTFSEDRIIDETVTRSSCVLHTFTSIMLASHSWIGESLFHLLKIASKRGINTIQLKKVLTCVALKLRYDSLSDFLEKHLIPLYNHWKIHNLTNIPFDMFNCESHVEFHGKYWHILSPHIPELNADLLQSVARFLNKTPTDLMQSSGPKILAYCIAKETHDMETFVDSKNYTLMCQTLGVEQVKQIFLANIDEVFLYLSEFLCDKDGFKKSFGENVIFPKFDEIQLSTAQFQESIQFIENTLFDGDQLFSRILQSHPDKVQRIFLHINIELSKARSIEDKFRYFHVYAILAQLCIESAIDVGNFQSFLVRDLTYTLLHLINNHENEPELALIACRFFKEILEKMLPVLSKAVEIFLVVIVSRLSNISKKSNKMTGICVEILHLLLNTNKVLFTHKLKRLPAIFGTKQDCDLSLEEEIKRFLYYTKNLDILDECTEGLSHLETALMTRKEELKALYERLREHVKFSEDCDTELLHQLICILINLTCSANTDVQTKALRCLGEIGPADLSTLVLQPEKTIPDPKWSPWELISGCTISLLSKYIIDKDVNVVKAASEAFYKVLDSKAAKHVADSRSDFGFGNISPDFLTPFFCKHPTRTNVSLNLDSKMFLERLNDEELWLPINNNNHEKWITDLVCQMLACFLEQEVFTTFIEVCKMKLEFCEQLLPVIIFSIIFINASPLTALLSDKIQSFFNEHWTVTVNEEKRECQSIATNKSSVQCMLNVVNFVRLQRHFREKKLHKNLEVDYLKVAKAAQFCSAHFTSLLCAELWCQENISNSPGDFCESSCSATKLDLIYERINPSTEKAIQDILRTGYKAIGETDALLGCGTSYLLDPHCRIEHYKESGRWDQVIHHYENEISHGKKSTLPLMESLKNSNLYQLSLLCSNSSEETQFESLWRLGRWDYNKPSEAHTCDVYNKHIFYAFKSLHDNDEFAFKEATKNVKDCLLRDLSDVNLESSHNVYGILSRIQSIKEIEEFSRTIAEHKIHELLDVWRSQDEISNAFQYIEPIRSQRIILLRDYLQKRPNGQLRQCLYDIMLHFAEYARIEGHWASASRTLEDLRCCPGLPNDVQNKLKFEDAQLCWSMQDFLSATCILKQLCNNENVDPKLHSMAYRMTGKWMVEKSSESRQTIRDYFLKSLEFIPKSGHGEQDYKLLVDTYDQLAKFSDAEYQHVMSHIKSDVFQKKRSNMEKAKQTADKVDLRNATLDLRKAVMIKKKQFAIDEQEIRNMEEEKDELLKLALRYYLHLLVSSDQHNTSMFRLISLLLENRNNLLVKRILEKSFHKIPTYKFITILPQLLPHITANDSFSEAIVKVIEACAKDHPYHVLPMILSLAFATKDRDYAKESKVIVNDSRMQCAKNLLNRLRKVPKLSNLIKNMETTSEAIIQLAYLQVNKTVQENKDISIPRSAKISSIRGYEDVLVPTYTLPVSKSCDYENKVIGITRFGDKFQFVGGINSPKQIKCLGTDGITRTQLVKGQDDLRQDAVMQQVFTIMNGFLSANKQTEKLLIRTYKVVPLSMRSGILEWVDNSMPLGDYLVGNNKGFVGAHEKYRPMDKSPMKSRTDFKKGEKQTFSKKLEIFQEVCQNIKPIFHKFFEETFPQAAVWYERRRAYIHSVATTSMCGYILGIGDRHVSNILIDMSTAEVIHIDFGIAFEQGKVLTTPETVPFRLTRDVVDGMGVSGIEGVFRKSCEKTMEVLRRNQQTILTIVEVLLYDPLYDWTVSTAEAHKRQQDDDSEMHDHMNESCEDLESKNVNVTAERALLRLRAKLQGTEDGKPSTVENQVGTLIQQAMDPSNLCRLFQGWQPFL